MKIVIHKYRYIYNTTFRDRNRYILETIDMDKNVNACDSQY